MVWLSVLTFLVSMVIGGWVLRGARRRSTAYGQDKPQRLHAGEVPRLGGVGLLAGLLMGWLVGLVNSQWGGDPSSLRLEPWTLSWCVALLPAVIGGLHEDCTQRLTVRYRLLLTLLTAALGITLAGLYVPRVGLPWLDQWMLELPWIGMALAALALAGLPHAFNIIDGCNGLAGMVALITALAIAHVALQLGDRGLATLMVVMAASSAGFLVWNYPRGLLFAGDGGAYLWGSVIAFGAIALVQRHPQVSPWFPVLLLIYPVWETLFSIYRKLARGVSPGVADALHFHQLVYRRIVRGVVHEADARKLLRRNNRTAPYLWGFTLLTVLPALLFWRSTWVLMVFTLLFVITYVLAYLAMIRFKLPGWLRDDS